MGVGHPYKGVSKQIQGIQGFDLECALACYFWSVWERRWLIVLTENWWAIRRGEACVAVVRGPFFVLWQIFSFVSSRGLVRPLSLCRVVSSILDLGLGFVFLASHVHQAECRVICWRCTVRLVLIDSRAIRSSTGGLQLPSRPHWQQYVAVVFDWCCWCLWSSCQLCPCLDSPIGVS